MFEQNLVLNRNWAEAFKKQKELDSEAILEKVRALEARFYRWFWLTTVILVVGGIQLCSGRGSVANIGLWLALCGLIGNMTIKLSTQIRLSTLWMMWEQRRREETEMRRSLAEDL